MTGMLERMVLRARSGLAGIEPLYRPRYVPAADAAQGPAEWSGESNVAPERLPAPTPSGRPVGHAPASPVVPTDFGPAPRAALHRPHAASRDADVDLLPRAAPPRPRAPEDIHQPRASVVSLAASGDPPARSNPPAPPVAFEAAAVSLSADAAAALEPAPSLPVPAGAEPAAPPPAPEVLTVSLRAPADDAATHAPARETALTVAAFERSGPQPQRVARGPEPEAARPPDLTISIGHIEVRAAQVSERPRRPAFRPRLTLDDFLASRNGAPR